MRLPQIAFLILIFTLACSPGAWAHARLVKADPKSGAELSTTPKQVDLWFNELLEDGFNTVTVFSEKEIGEAKKTNYAKDKPVVDPKDRTHLLIKLGTLPPGEYIIEWRVLSRDGHSAPGRSTFRVRAP